MILFWCMIAACFAGALVYAFEHRNGWGYFLAACGLIFTLLIIALRTTGR